MELWPKLPKIGPKRTKIWSTYNPGKNLGPQGFSSGFQGLYWTRCHLVYKKKDLIFQGNRKFPRKLDFSGEIGIFHGKKTSIAWLGQNHKIIGNQIIDSGIFMFLRNKNRWYQDSNQSIWNQFQQKSAWFRNWGEFWVKSRSIVPKTLKLTFKSTEITPNSLYFDEWKTEKKLEKNNSEFLI